jgi:hypothetical protein
MPDKSSARIKFALRLASWPVGGDSRRLDEIGERVVAADYTPAMDGELFCPGCYTSLTRTPRDKLYFSNGRRACFAHLPRFAETPCDLRTPTPEGLRFANEELAREAVERGDLVVVSSFMDVPPEAPVGQAGEYDQSQVEDIDGPWADVPIARHQGDQYRLPSRVSTVMNLCRRFDRNLTRHYVLPGSQVPRRLIDLLVDGNTAVAPDASPKLYYAKITSSQNMGQTPANVRMTWLEHSAAVADLCLKDSDRNQAMKGISDEAKGRTVLIWSTVVESGVGLAFNQPGWGGYALLPPKYEHLLAELADV